MTKLAAQSALEIANWFLKKAETSKIYLEEDKLHALIFLSQTHYALKNKLQYLMPAVFICDSQGFFEPNLKKILEFGMPLMGDPRLSPKITDFLELIWQKYADKNTFELISIIKNSPAYQKFYNKNEVCIVSLEDMTRDFNIPEATHTAPKVLISQNGPVVVSKWQPRKLDNSKK